MTRRLLWLPALAALLNVANALRTTTTVASLPSLWLGGDAFIYFWLASFLKNHFSSSRTLFGLSSFCDFLDFDADLFYLLNLLCCCCSGLTGTGTVCCRQCHDSCVLVRLRMFSYACRSKRLFDSSGTGSLYLVLILVQIWFRLYVFASADLSGSSTIDVSSGTGSLFWLVLAFYLTNIAFFITFLVVYLHTSKYYTDKLVWPCSRTGNSKQFKNRFDEKKLPNFVGLSSL